MPKVLIAANSAWNLVNFRRGLISALIAAGYEVVAVAQPDGFESHLLALNSCFVPLSIDSKGTHPVYDALLWFRFYRLLRREQPNIYLGYTVKPNIYGSLAAHAIGIPVINTITGLGSVFIRNSWLTRLVCGLYRFALLKSVRVFFQNRDDRRLFISRRLVHERVTDCLPGSGIDLVKFSLKPLPSSSTIRFLLIARMLWDKGIGEFVEAARLLKLKGVNADFCLMGSLDAQNPTAITSNQMDAWVREGAVRYLGVSNDVRPEIEAADCIVLPSYREGTPRSLLEAAAMGRPIITSDTVGCREVVEDGVNGYLCTMKSASSLADKMASIAAMSGESRTFMGQQGRKKMEREFDEQIVIKKYCNTIKKYAST